MPNTILGLYANLLNVIGTIVAVLCILKLSFKDLSKMGTIERLSYPEIEVFVQRRFALKGISIIILGFITSIINAFCSINWIALGIIIVVSLLVAYRLNIYFNIEHTALLQAYDEYLKKLGKESPLDVAVNGAEIRNKKVPLNFKFDKYK